MHTAVTLRLTRSALLSALAERGFVRRPRWHERWIELGLLDRGDRIASGRYSWPVAQLELATALLKQSAKGVSLGALPKVVVFIWLWWGDAYVPRRQIARAMKTWARAEAEAPVKRVRATAMDLAARVAHARGSGKRRLTSALTDFPATGDPETLRDAFDAVFDPDARGVARGPAGAKVSTDSYLALVGARQRAIAHLGTYSDEQFDQARALCRHSRAEYARLQPEYAKDPDLGRMHPPADINELADSACVDLLDALVVLFERPAVSVREGQSV
jgi:hypothetical protein